MRLALSETALPLSHPFTIARGSRLQARTVISRLEHDSIVGLGETAPIQRYHESVESVIAWFAEHPIEAEDPVASLTYDGGKMILPKGPGLGVVERI